MAKFILIQILPSCVRKEWSSNIVHLEGVYGFEKAVEKLTDVIIILIQVARSQSENSPTLAALKFCLQNYSIVCKVGVC